MTKEQEMRAAMYRELLDAGIERDEIIKRVVNATSPEEIMNLAESRINQEFLSVIGRISMDARIGSGRRVPEDVQAEREEFISYASAWRPSDNSDPGERVSRRAQLLKTTFLVPGHGFVAWGEATISQHTIRAEALEKMGATIFETAHLHRRAISEITAAKVETLAEIVALRHANEAAIEPAKPRKVRVAA